jgi:quinone-modifying oxidoreductase subunit QmoC
VCNVTPDAKPFPRKEMLYAQWGMKDKLISNPDIWLCHQCSDCTAHCPRGAKPGEVLGVIRKMAIKEYATPAALGSLVADPKKLPILFLIPAVLYLIIIGALGHLSLDKIPRTPEGAISYSKFLPPTATVDTVFVPVALFAALCFFAGVKKQWAGMKRADGAAYMPKKDLLTSIYETVVDIATHKKFAECNVAKGRKSSHMAVFYAFIGLAVTTGLAVVYLYILGRPSPYPMYDPLKIIGNISAVALLGGIIAVISNRFDNKEKAGLGGYYDWFFIGIVFGVGATGFLAQVLRLMDVAIAAYPMYYLHLIFIFVLFAYAPFSKMAHMVYRATAMVYARHTGRE